MPLRTLALSLFVVLLGTSPAGAQSIPVFIAAAGDLRGVLEEVQTRFEARHPGVTLKLSFGASGSLTAQIQQGAPFDVFLSADAGFPEQVRQAGLATPEAPFPYATGSLVLWVQKALGRDPAKDGWKVLLESSVKKIATANPHTAPYGRAGEAALRQAALYDAVRPRLVFGENIAQAAQFLQAGAAEAGLISFSQANQPALRQAGQIWIVPAGTYPPLRQTGVILKRTGVLAQAQAFRDFLTGSEGQAILAKHGFGKP